MRIGSFLVPRKDSHIKSLVTIRDPQVALVTALRSKKIMKTTFTILSLLFLFLAGCESTLKTKWAGGGAVHTDYTELSPNAFSLMARGALACGEEDVIEIWKWRASELAGGRDYEVQYETLEFVPGSLSGFRVVGTVTIKTGNVNTPSNMSDLPNLAEPKEELATIYIINGLGGSMAGSGEIVLLDDSMIGKINRKQYTWLFREPGELNIKINDPSMKKRTMAARTFSIEKGKTYYFSYKPVPGKSDGQLLLEVIGGASKGKEEFSSEDIQSISYNEAIYLISSRTFVPNSINEGSNQSVDTTPVSAPR